MEIQLIDIEETCRCCLAITSEDQQMDNIFDCTYDEMDLNKILQIIAPIALSCDDGLTQLICESCKFNAIQAYNFRCTCISSNELLRSTNENVAEDADPTSIEFQDDPAQEFLEEEAFESDLEGSSEDYEELQNICMFCDEIFETSSDLTNHVATSHEHKILDTNSTRKSSKKYECLICSKEFPTPSKLLRHKIVHRDVLDPSDLPAPVRRPLKYSCNFCGKHVETPSKLERHLRVHNKSEKLYTGINQHRPHRCDKCNKRFWDPLKHERHQVIHSKDVENSIIQRPANYLFTCVVCLQQFSEFEESMKHMKEHRDDPKDDKDDVECKLCFKKYRNLSNLIRHSLTHPENATHQCSHCEKLFGMGEDFLEHMLRHQGFKPFSCDFPNCNKSFIKLHKLRAHKMSHNAFLEKPFTCDQCQKSFSDKEYLKRHMMRHSGRKDHACPICPARFTFKSGLTSHMVTHDNQRNFSCDICSAKFTKKHSLRTHSLIHTGDKRFKCEICEMGFTTSGHLSRHSRTHSGARPYQCKYCSKSYGQSNDLIKHMRSHLGINVYRCDIGDCKEGFPKFKELKQHKMIHFRNGDMMGEETYCEDIEAFKL